MLTIDPTKLRAALQARARAAALYLYDPRVSLIDVGLRIREQEGGRVTEELTVRVHVRYKPRGPALKAFAARSPERVIDEGRIGFPVDIVEADYRLQWHWFTAPVVSPRARVFNPLQGGISISNELDNNFGTCGGLVRDRQTGIKMILSAWHVLAGSEFARPGLRILQPGMGDGGRLRHTVARLTRHGMDGGIDAAVAELIGSRPMVNGQLELGSVSGAITPMLDMQVTKSGRASDVTEGIISGIEGEQPIRYRGFIRKIRHVFHIVQTPAGREVSAGGDSGAWWLEAGTNKAVGLHFAGDNVPEYALAIDMPQVLNALNVEILA